MFRLSIVVTLAACTGSSDAEEDDDGSPSDTEIPPADVLADAFGGRSALEALTGFSYDATGSRSVFGQGRSPDDGAQFFSDFDLVVSDDRATNSLRYTWDRSQFGVTFATYDETCVKRLGVVDGVDNLLFGVSTGDMPSSRWAAVTKQHRLLNPHLIALDALADPTLVTTQPDEVLDDVSYHVIRYADPIAPIDFLIDASTGTLDTLRTFENDHLRRDVSLELHYGRWKTYDEGASFPREVTLSLAGEVLHEESRSSIQVNPDLPADRFSFPDGSDPEYDAELADFGAKSSQYHEQGTSLGFVLDEPQLAVGGTEIVPGIDLLFGATHNSLVVKQEDGVILVESPLYPERGDAVLDWIAGQYPGVPVTHVVVTHHHSDHAGGVRAIVAAGAAVVVSAQTVDLLESAWTAPSTVSPDTLATAPVTPDVEAVADDGSVTLPDPVHPVTAWHLDSPHASDSLVVQIGSPTGDVVFNSDLFIPGGGGGTFDVGWSEQLKELIDEKIGGEPTLAGGHGSFGPYDELVDLVE